jgi:hypothetical protein
VEAWLLVTCIATFWVKILKNVNNSATSEARDKKYKESLEFYEYFDA